MKAAPVPDPILLVDDDEVLRSRLQVALTDRGHRVEGAGNGEEAREIARRLRPAGAVVDLKMPGEGGLEVMQSLLEIDGDLQVVVLTGYGSIATTKEAIQLGAVDYLTKPADADQILAALQGRRIVSEEPDEGLERAPSLARVEWEHIQRILHDCDGNVSRAARVLGIHRRSLQRKLYKNPPPGPKA